MKLLHLTLCAVALVLAQLASAQVAQDGPDPAQVSELVLANHILANEGVLDAYGHVSARDPRHPDRFLLSRAAPAGAVTASDIVEYDLNAQPVSNPNAGGYIERYIHAEIYRARPDVMAIIHSHSADVIPFTVTNVPLRPMIHVAGYLPQNVPIFDIRKNNGMTDLLIRTPQLGKELASTLAANPIVLLRGHGAVVVGPSLHVVVGRAYYMTVNARTEQQAILLAGDKDKVTFLAPEEAAKAADQDGFERAWTLWKSKLEKQPK
jgi:HCOMODA/2-hydroxy-3-carboxy-muconic semialdehyde decarboxylase